MFAALVKVRKKDFCIVLAGKHQSKRRDRAPLRRDRPKQALFGAVGVIMLKPGARFSKKSRELFGPEKPFVKLRQAYCVKLVFSYVV